MIIAVVGGDAASPADAESAYQVGLELGRRGHVLVCGGRGGVMLEACRGAREAGGHTIGILPGDDRSEANEFVEFPIATGLGHVRNTIVVRSADAVIAIGGRYGTLSEIAFALIARKPVAGLGSWDLIQPDGKAVPIHVARSAREAVDYCESAATKE